MKKISLICPEPIRSLQQGIGIRFIEMATELSNEHAVSLWAPSIDINHAFPFSLNPLSTERFIEEVIATDIVIIHGHVSDWYFDLLQENQTIPAPYLVVDLYDPFLIENLNYTRQLGESIYYRDRTVLFRQLALGDFFLCSSESQRLFYTGLLIGVGRFTPAVYQQDSTMRCMIDVAPFGVRPFDPSRVVSVAGRLKEVVAGIGKNDLVVFFGGIYDWYDPNLLLDVLEHLIAQVPSIRVIFSINPSPDTTPQGTFEHIRQRAAEHAWIGHNVFFIPWFPYAERMFYLKDVDVAVCLHKPSLETDLSLRTRIIDYLNFGIPIIATAGGESGRILQSAGGGILVPPGDGVSLRNALLHLAQDGQTRSTLGQQGYEWIRHHMTWDKALAPLIRFCKSPYQSAPINTEFASRLNTEFVPRPLTKSTIKKLYHYWRYYGSKHLLLAVSRRLFGHS